MNKSERDIRQFAKANGCGVEPTKSGHWVIRTPGGHAVFHSGSSSDWRAMRNLISQVRRAIQEEQNTKDRPV